MTGRPAPVGVTDGGTKLRLTALAPRSWIHAMEALGRTRYYATIDATMALECRDQIRHLQPDLQSSLAAVDIDEVLLERPGNSGNSGNFLAARERRKNYFLARLHHLRALSGGAQGSLWPVPPASKKFLFFRAEPTKKFPELPELPDSEAL